MSATYISSAAPYTGSTPNVVLTGGGLIIGVIAGSGGDGNSITAATLDGVSGTLFGTVNSAAGAEESVSTIFTWADQGAKASAPMTVTAGAGITGIIIRMFEFDSTGLTGLASNTYGGADPINTTVSIAGNTGKTVIAYGVVSDGSAFPTANTVTNPSANLSSFLAAVNTRCWMASGYDPDAATDPTAYTMTFDPDAGAGGGALDRGLTAAFVVNDPAPTTLTCDSITGGTIRAGDTVRINLSNSPGSSGYVLSTAFGALTTTAETATYVEFSAFDPKLFGNKQADYNTNITVTVSLLGESDTIDFPIAPDVGDEVGAITALEGIYAEPEFSGVAVTDLYYTTTISGADFAVGAVPVLATEQTFQLWIQDQTDGVWGSPFTVTISGSATTAIDIILHDVLRDVLKPVLKDVMTEG